MKNNMIKLKNDNQLINICYLCIIQRIFLRMFSWKKSIRESFKESSKFISKSQKQEAARESQKLEEKLESMFASVKKMLSFLLKIASLQLEINSEDSLEFAQFQQKLNNFDSKLKEEFSCLLTLQSIFVFKQEEIQEINYIKMLNRRIKMLLRLVLPPSYAIDNKIQKFFSKFDEGSSSSPKSQFTEKSNFQSLWKKYSGQFLVFYPKTFENKTEANRIERSSKILCFFFGIIDIFLNQIFSIQKQVLAQLKKKKINLQEAKNIQTITTDIIQTQKVIHKLEDVTNYFRNKNQISILDLYLRTQIYDILDLQKIQVLNNTIPGVQHATNEFLNLGKQKKRNKRIKKDIKYFQQAYTGYKQRHLNHLNRQKLRKERQRHNNQSKNESKQKIVRFHSEDSKKISQKTDKTKQTIIPSFKNNIKIRAITHQPHQIRDKSAESSLNRTKTNLRPLKIPIMKPLRTNHLKLR